MASEPFTLFPKTLVLHILSFPCFCRQGLPLLLFFPSPIALPRASPSLALSLLIAGIGTYPPPFSSADHRSLGHSCVLGCSSQGAKNGAWDWVLGTECCRGYLRKVSSFVSFVRPLFPHALLLHRGKTEDNDLFDGGTIFGY